MEQPARANIQTTQALWVWRKAEIVKRLLKDPGETIVWVDDEIPISLQQFGGAMPDPHGRLRTVAPDPMAGLTRADLGKIAAFLKD